MMDAEQYDAWPLIVYSLADIAAIFWGLSAVTNWHPSDVLGSSTTVALLALGAVGVLSLLKTWSNADEFDPVMLAVFGVADVSAILWGVTAVTDFSLRSALGGSSSAILFVVGVVGAWDLLQTWADIG